MDGRRNPVEEALFYSNDGSRLSPKPRRSLSDWVCGSMLTRCQLSLKSRLETTIFGLNIYIDWASTVDERCRVKDAFHAFCEGNGFIFPSEELSV